MQGLTGASLSQGKYSRAFHLSRGHRYYCTIHVPAGTHAVAIDEQGVVFDPSTNAPAEGACTLEQYVKHNHKTSPGIFISCCYPVLNKRQVGDVSEISHA